MFKLRMIWRIIKEAGLVHISVVFAFVFAACTFGVLAFDRGVTSLADAAWYCFQAVTTIGFGDVLVQSPAARLATVALSVISVFYLAVITGAVVSYCSEIMALRRNQSVMHFMDQLEHLEDLSPEELADLSRKVRAFRAHGGPAEHGAAGAASGPDAAGGSDAAGTAGGRGGSDMAGAAGGPDDPNATSRSGCPNVAGAAGAPDAAGAAGRRGGSDYPNVAGEPSCSDSPSRPNASTPATPPGRE